MEICISIYNQGKEKELSRLSKSSEETDEEDEDDISPLAVGHNVYILAYKLSEHKKELKDALEQAESADAIKYYANHTAQIEVKVHSYCLVDYECIAFGLVPIINFQIVRTDRKLEQIVFPVPSVCQFLTEESKRKVIYKTKCNEQGSKVDDFFKQTTWLFEEMQCQKELRGENSCVNG